MISFNRPAMPCRRGGFFNSHPGGKEQNGHRRISEDFTFLIGGPKLFPVSHRSQASLADLQRPVAKCYKAFLLLSFACLAATDCP
jgi:hypothetical protein